MSINTTDWQERLSLTVLVSYFHRLTENEWFLGGQRLPYEKL